MSCFINQNSKINKLLKNNSKTKEKQIEKKEKLEEFIQKPQSQNRSRYMTENNSDDEFYVDDILKELNDEIRMEKKRDQLKKKPIQQQKVLDFVETKTIIKEKKENIPTSIQFTVIDIDKQKLGTLQESKHLFDEIDQIANNKPEISAKIMDQILVETPNQEQTAEDKEVTKNIEKEASKGDAISTMLLQIKNIFTFKGSESPITFSKKTSMKSKVSMKVLTTGFMSDQMKFTDRMEEDDQWKFKEIMRSEQKRQEFKQWYIKNTAQKYGLREDQIIIHRIIQGSIQVQFSTVKPANIVNHPDSKKLVLHPFFQNFTLSPEDFDLKGNHEFPENQGIDTRGGWPYLPPKNCKRYGIKVSGLYGSDDWLMMDKNPNQWAIAFHGVRSPNNICSNGKYVLKSIMDGREQGNMLIAGGGQAYAREYSLNKPHEYVGTGIYCSPYFVQALGYANESSKYCLVFQCRVNPKAIKVCSKDAYWVIKSPQNIRPYGVKPEVAKSYPRADVQYPNDYFTWNRYKGKINY